MKYFKDSQYSKILHSEIIVRTIDDSFRMEYIFKGAGQWIQTEHDHPYEREYWLGEGSQCLDDITEEEANIIIASWENGDE